MEWLRLLPKPGLRPQMEQTFDIRRLDSFAGPCSGDRYLDVCSMRDSSQTRKNEATCASYHRDS